MLKKINSLFVTIFGIGKLPRIPGSYASLVTVIFLYILFHIFSVTPDVFLFFLVAIFIISLFSVNLFIKDLTNKDPKEVVIDEFIGQSIPICLYEIAHKEPTDPARVLTFYFIMFILFRIRRSVFYIKFRIAIYNRLQSSNTRFCYLNRITQFLCIM